MNRNLLHIICLVICLFISNAGWVFAKDRISFVDNPSGIIHSPENKKDWKKFRADLHNWRNKQKKDLKYNDSLYTNSNFHWVHKAYNCYMLMLFDQRFFNIETNEFDAAKIIQYGKSEFGGFDIVVLWHAYPMIGLDDRNQYDFYRETPGGLAGLKVLATQLQMSGIKVFINYNPWDVGTRREKDTDIELLSEIVKQIGADGIFLDTMDSVAEEFRENLNQIREGVILESELALPIPYVNNHHASWAQWFDDSYAPGILRNKWYERKHMQHSISRWNHDRTPEIHTAWMNGSGIMIWDNVFGQWVGWNEYNKTLVRQITSIQKRYHYLFSGENWHPLYEGCLQDSIFAGLWHDDQAQLWTLINRSNKPVSGNILVIEKKPKRRYFDLIRGNEIIVNSKNKKIVLSGYMDAKGIGCIISVENHLVNKEFDQFLAEQKKNYELRNLNKHFPETVRVTSPIISSIKKHTLPVGMTRINGIDTTINYTYRLRECGLYEPTDNYFVNKRYPQLHQEIKTYAKMSIPDFAIDNQVVTNGQFIEFVQATGYKPACEKNFLKHAETLNLESLDADKPVVYIDQNDARAYAKWLGKRLPTEYEWQWAMMTEKISYGQVWEMTENVYSDSVNRFCILKGGSDYQAKGSEWYFDGGKKSPEFSAKKLLFYPGIDRCKTVGFRCVIDL